ncbi:hypothetical protein APUTEX25_000442, partial [Auxenochlorella protothecoides]
MGSFIIMEFIERAGPVDQGQLGVNLAAMHEATPVVRRDEKAAAGFFGFAVDNSIGGTPQRNTWTQSWPEFFREHRLRPQLEASGSAELQRMAEPLLESLDRLFAGVTPCPALLHGDLWSGNVAGSREGPVVFDPATYYGHAEAEFGMVWCSGFGRDFWEGYHAVLPRDPGWEGRQELYTLYHKLVQRRFRERQKSRAAALQAQMEELEGEMGVLRLERAALARKACGPRCLGVAVPAGGCLLGADSHEELLALHGAFQAELKIQYERALGGGYPEPALAALATLVDGWAQTFWHLAQTRHELLIGFMTASLPADSRHHQAWPTIAVRYVERTTVAAAAMPRWRRRIALLASLDLGTSLHRISRDTDELLNLTGRMQHASEEEFWASMELAASGPYATFPDSWQAYICYWSLPFMPDPVALVFHILRQGQAAGR